MSSKFRRGTGGPGGTPLKEYGDPNTFGLAIAEKLAASGLTKDEYVQIAKNFKADETRFNDYIRYFKKEKFNIVLENGRYVYKTESSNSLGSTLTQAASSGELPAKNVVENILHKIDPKRNEIDEDVLKRAIEDFYASEDRKLNPDWWELTKINLIEWSTKG